MAPVLLDHQPLCGLDLTHTVRDIVGSLRARLRDEDRMVTRIECDGRELSPADTEIVLDRVHSQVGELHFHTDRLSTLILGTLRQAHSLMADIRIAQVSISDALAEGRIPDAMGDLGDFMRSWSQLLAVVERCASAMELDLGTLQVAGKSVDQHLFAVAAVLRGLKDALTIQDFVLVGDQMRYEMTGPIEAWHSVIAAMIDRVQTTSVA